MQVLSIKIIYYSELALGKSIKDSVTQKVALVLILLFIVMLFIVLIFCFEWSSKTLFENN